MFLSQFLLAIGLSFLLRGTKAWKPRHYLENLCGSKSNNCTVVDFEISSFSVETLVSTLESAAFQSDVHSKLRPQFSFYFVELSVSQPQASVVLSQKEGASSGIDEFLTGRPWWVLRQFPSSKSPQLILERVPDIVERAGRVIVAVHFPSLDGCAHRPMHMKTSVGSWGNDIIVNQRSFFEQFPSAVHALYVTDSGLPSDELAYVETKWCPNIVDKHQCTFLRISNCTVPLALTSCNQTSCVKEGLYPPFSAQHHHHTDSHRVDALRESLNKVDFWDVYPRLFQHAIPDSPVWRIKDTLLPIHSSNAVEDTSRRLEQVRENYHTLHWLFNVLYRPNALLAVTIQDLLRNFYASPSASHRRSTVVNNKRRVLETAGSGLMPGDKCTALHIRMGDRHLNDTDMVQWCKDHTNADMQGDDRAKGTWFDGSPVDMGRWHDMGCSWRLPFGALTVAHFVDAALHLQPDVFDLFLMTDDHEWLHRAMDVYRRSKQFRSDVRIHVFPTQLADVHASRRSLQATSEWWAAIEAARHCSALVGHMGSAATYAVYWALCFHHNEQYWRCPPFFIFD